MFLKAHGYRPQQVQDFIPAPMDIATCMFWTGLDPTNLKPVSTVTRLRDRRIQRALMQYFKAENWFEVQRALTKYGRADLIGSGPQCLIPSSPPTAAIEARRRKAQDATYVHAKEAGTKSSVGYRPGRKGATRRGRD